MLCKDNSSSPVQRRTPWNKGKLIGAKPPLRLDATLPADRRRGGRAQGAVVPDRWRSGRLR
jgi:hypothetical protein